MIDCSVATEYPIYADDNSFLGICHSQNDEGKNSDIKIEFKSKNKTVSLNNLISQVYNPAKANKRRRKTK